METNTIMSNKDNQNFSDKELEQKKANVLHTLTLCSCLAEASAAVSFHPEKIDSTFYLWTYILHYYKVLKFMETSLQTLIKAYSSNQVWWGNEARWASSC